MLGVEVDDHFLDRLEQLAAIVAAEQHLRPRHAELEALAAHGLDQNAELQLAAAGDLHRVALIGFGDAQRDIALGLAQQAVADHAARHLVAFGAGERRIVDAEGHGERRRIDRLGRQRLGDLGRADGVRHRGVGQPGERDDVAGGSLVERDALKPAEGEHLGDAALLDQPAVMVEHLDRLVRRDGAGGDAAGDDAAEIGIGFEDGAEQAERSFLDVRRRDMAEHEIEQRLHARLLRALGALRHPALLGRAVEDGEIELLVGGIEAREQVEDLVDHLVRPRIGAVDLVDDDDGLQPHLQRLRHHELGLRQRAFGGIDQHQSAVDHVEDALDLAAEIGVAWRVDDVDAGALPEDGGRLGEDGDAALALEVVGIHGALGHALVLAERAGLLEQPVDEGGLAMVDMGDDGDVAKLHGVLNCKTRA